MGSVIFLGELPVADQVVVVLAVGVDALGLLVAVEEIVLGLAGD